MLGKYLLEAVKKEDIRILTPENTGIERFTK